MDLLSTKEELILTSIWKLQKNAYGMAIRKEIITVTSMNWLLGSIYTPINGLLKKGIIESTKGEPSPIRGGRAKVYFILTKRGIRAMAELQKVNKFIWQNIPSLEPT